MSEIPPVGLGIAGPVERPVSFPGDGVESPRLAERLTDRVELSDHARLVERLQSLPDVRTERVAEIRRAIATGTYETEARLDSAIDRLMEELDTE